MVDVTLAALDLVRSFENAKKSCSSFLDASCGALGPEVVLLATCWLLSSVPAVVVEVAS